MNVVFNGKSTHRTSSFQFYTNIYGLKPAEIMLKTVVLQRSKPNPPSHLSPGLHVPTWGLAKTHQQLSPEEGPVLSMEKSHREQHF